MAVTAELETPARAVFARPDANVARVTQEHKLRIGWHFVPAGLDPLRELAFYQGSVFAKLFERVDLSAELDESARSASSRLARASWPTRT